MLAIGAVIVIGALGRVEVMALDGLVVQTGALLVVSSLRRA